MSDKQQRYLSIRTKLTVLISAMVVLVSSGITTFFVLWERGHSYEDLLQQGVAIASMATGVVEYGIYTQDRESLNQIAESILKNKHIVYVTVEDSEGKILVEVREDPFMKIDSERGVGRMQGSSETGQPAYVSTQDRDAYIDISAAVVSMVKADALDVLEPDAHTAYPKVIGHVNIGVTKEPVRARMRHFVISAIIVTVVVCLAGIGLTLVTAQAFISPIRQLAEVAKAISEGAYDHNLRVRGNDEVTELTRAFKKMLDRLKESWMQVQARTAALDAANRHMQEEIVQRREAQEIARKLNEELEERVKQRTHDLEQAYEELKELDRLKDAFISSVSHELRTPLTSIRSFSEILLTYPDTDAETTREFVSIINMESERLTRLVNDVLDLAKIKSGKINWSIDTVDLEGVVKKAVQSQQGALVAKELRLEVDLDPELPPIKANEDKMIQVLTNLLSNAIKFTPPGGSITIQCSQLHSRRADDATDFVHISVRDTGIGIPEEEIPKLFTPFTQCGHDVLTDKPAGTGLGLSIAKEIVTFHGGNIWVESTLGKGSVFHITVPIDRILTTSNISTEHLDLQPIDLGQHRLDSRDRFHSSVFSLQSSERPGPVDEADQSKSFEAVQGEGSSDGCIEESDSESACCPS